MGPGRELELRREMATRCRACGTCRSVCPIFAELGVEGAVARGKVVLIRAVLDGELDLTDLFDEKIQLCLNCKACIASCPSDVRVDDLVLAARADLVGEGHLSFLRRLIFCFLLKRGRLLPPFGRSVSFVQRSILRGLPRSSIYRKLLPIVGSDGDRLFPRFAPRSFVESMPDIVSANGRAGATASSEADDRLRIAGDAGRVGFFVGCATNLVYPDTGRAIVDAIARSGVDVVIPQGQGCCGSPVFGAGDYVTARELAKTNIRVFKAARVDAVVTGCASCGLSLKREYETTLGIDGGIGIPVFDFTEFLIARGGSGTRTGAAHGMFDADSARLRVTYHEPCHLSRGQGITEEPRAVIRSLPGVEFVEMHDSDRCCGGGGTFSLTHYDLATAVGKRKAEAIRATGADVVVTECPACVMQLRDMVQRYGVNVEVKAIADLLVSGHGGS